MYSREISKEELAEYVWKGWLGDNDVPDDLIEFIEKSKDIPWMDLHVVVRKDLRRVGIFNLNNPKIKKGFSGFQKIKGITVLIICADNANIGIYHDGIRLRAIEVSGGSVDLKKTDICKKIKPSFEFVEKIKEKSPTKRKAKPKKQIEEEIEGVVEGVVESAIEEVIEDIGAPDGEVIKEENDDK